jgi:hypothetical protein
MKNKKKHNFKPYFMYSYVVLATVFFNKIEMRI